MSLKDLEPGQYKGRVLDWGVVEVPHLDNQIQMVVNFKLETGDQIQWKSFFKKKDGTLNKKTTNTLETLGFQGNIQNLMHDGALNKTKIFDLTIIKNEQGYTEIEWVNDPDAPRGVSMMDKTMAMRKLAGLNLTIGTPKGVKNYAESIGKKIDKAVDEMVDDLPF